MRIAHILLAVTVVAPLSGRAVDPSTQPRDVERLAASRAVWEKARGAAGGCYSYEVLEISLVSRQTTRVVVKNGRVVERSFEQFAFPPGGRPLAPTKKWTETGAEIGTHGDGAVPARTVDELYDKAEQILAAPAVEFRTRSLGIDERQLLHHCYEQDSRIADDAPLDGVKPMRITFEAR